MTQALRHRGTSTDCPTDRNTGAARQQVILERRTAAHAPPRFESVNVCNGAYCLIVSGVFLAYEALEEEKDPRLTGCASLHAPAFGAPSCMRLSQAYQCPEAFPICLLSLNNSNKIGEETTRFNYLACAVVFQAVEDFAAN